MIKFLIALGIFAAFTCPPRWLADEATTLVAAVSRR